MKNGQVKKQTNIVQIPVVYASARSFVLFFLISYIGSLIIWEKFDQPKEDISFRQISSLFFLTKRRKNHSCISIYLTQQYFGKHGHSCLQPPPQKKPVFQKDRFPLDTATTPTILTPSAIFIDKIIKNDFSIIIYCKQ